jgi:ADP-ribosylglycohydrolase
VHSTTLFSKVHGSITAGNIGSAIGAAVEWVSVPGGGWPALEAEFGWVTDLLPWVQRDREVRYWNASPRLHYQHMDMPPGMTEDGAEIRYLLVRAIIENGGRIDVDDLAAVFRRDIVREDIGRLVNPHIKIHLDRLMAGDSTSRIPARLIGSMTPWPGLVDATHMIGPIGIVNACNPRQAALDAAEVSLIMQPPASGGVDGAMVIAAATAEAFRPEATVDSVVEAGMAYVGQHTREIIEETLEIASRHPDIREIREPIRQHFMPTYPYADGVETAAEALALFWITKGDVREGLVGATNIGRDTDCIAGCLGSISGAFSGIENVPSAWVETVQAAIDANAYTLQKQSMFDQAVDLVRVVTDVGSELKSIAADIDRLGAAAPASI